MNDHDRQQPGLLRRVDLLVVPALQRGARRAARLAGAPLRVLTRWEGRIARGRLIAVTWPRRSGLLLLIVAIAVLGSAVHFERYPQLAEQAAAEAAAARRQTVRQAGAAPSGALPGAELVVVGPVVGSSAEAYVTERVALLDAAPDDERRLAVVSFTTFTAAASAAELLPDGLTLHLAQYRLPDIDARPVQTEVVAGDLAGSIGRVLDDERAAIVGEEREVAQLLESGTVEDEGFRADLEARAEELKTIRNVLDTGGAVVFALVVEGSVETLRALQAIEGVRLVDLAPPEAVVDGSVFYGLLPDDRDAVTSGAAAEGEPALGDG